MKLTEPQHELLSINGTELSVLQQASIGTERGTIVLLHGFTGSANNWLPFFSPLMQSGLRVIALDMLGHGRSSAPDDPERYQMHHVRTDVLLALQQLGVQAGTAILLGYSMGGRIALGCALSGYFRALILESASPGLSTAVEREERRASDEALAGRIEKDGVARFVEDWERLPLFATQQHLSPAIRERLHAQRMQNRAVGLANSLRGIGTGAQPALHMELATLDLPVLLLAGALDQKFCGIARQMAQSLPHAQLQIIPEAGHTIHLEQPAAFLIHVQAFCQSVL
ncbi:2-succinyl-6-hydroxy-2,4-cyclohexadiene-1-carboxylate synthase [Tengunoibacter tsumagoiensis]|uniref:Putative 2-succinyl-6-hydroxy-2,4-cyclohexadiene-1-carboxylate synthase n=1 Tax=Tengunoibacter tsumagoiensis TaxID=2014871 RepID=A0A401ZXC6_9CHLR|nr:2-succinyl-6-hydroxy-2,4-cyclohexadiene-1-carboxylate synthase [Tengunoibacter tsumagoiensis]GCE11508.1 putative 2-succinyl-6-hydroxy-2,4-cyclohexadiene-1-carboxylate synthase [Tengunoibacter tsumagoiensis]